MEVLPEEVNLYLAAVGMLREQGVTDASRQVQCEVRREPWEYVIKASGAVRPVLVAQLQQALQRDFDVLQTHWALSPREANRLIDRWAVL